MIARGLISVACLVLASSAHALELGFPAETETVSAQVAPRDSYFLATAPFAEGPLTGIVAEGEVQHTSLHVGGGELTTLQILAPLREQLVSAGYETLFECESRTCGGFDFRYGLDLLPEPDMHVNLADFRYLSAMRDADGYAEYVALMVSRSAKTGFVQLSRITEQGTSAVLTTSTKAPPTMTAPSAAGEIGELLELSGHAILGDLYFKTGSSELGDERFASLDDLARYLNVRPDRRIVLVGHTDSQGGLSANVALSRKRAASVMERLINQYGVSSDQVSADGVGYLSPRATNLTDEGRAQNRRVEAILTSTQ